MSPQKLKRTLQKELRAKRNNRNRFVLILGPLLIGLLIIGSYLLWNKHRPAALLQQGIQLEQQNELDRALNLYARVIKKYSASPQTAVALYRSGKILHHDIGQVQRALVNYLQLEKDYPQSKLVIQAQREAAELTKYRLNDCEQAISIYQRLIDRASVNSVRYQYEIADCYARSKNWSQAAIEFESLLSSYPQTDLSAITYYRLADARLLNHQRKEAGSILAKIVSDYPQSPMAQEASFRLAEMLEEDEHLKKALQAYSKLTEYPRQELLKQKILRLKERMARKKKVL